MHTILKLSIFVITLLTYSCTEENQSPSDHSIEENHQSTAAPMTSNSVTIDLVDLQENGL